MCLVIRVYHGILRVITSAANCKASETLLCQANMYDIYKHESSSVSKQAQPFQNLSRAMKEGLWTLRCSIRFKQKH